MNQMLSLIIVLLLRVTDHTLAQVPEKIYPAEGVYTTFSAFRNGVPDVLTTQFVKPDLSADYTIRQWVNSENLYFIDSSQTKQRFDPKNFWGFVEKGTLYIFRGNKFHKVSTLGQISYFLESYPIVKGNMAPVVTDARTTSQYRLMDMETGDVMDYSPENLLDLLEKDETLFLEFKSIVSQKERKKKMFSFLERYNAAHPLH